MNLVFWFLLCHTPIRREMTATVFRTVLGVGMLHYYYYYYFYCSVRLLRVKS
jgi:hypothetical protein